MMKRFALSLSLFSLLITLSSFTLPTPSLIGKWKGTDNGEVGYINFDKAGYVSFIVSGEVVGGKKYSAEGIMLDMYYEFDESVTPHTIDFIIKISDGQMEVGRMRGIYSFPDKKTLVINMNFDGTDRPSSFDPEDPNQIIFTKEKG